MKRTKLRDRLLPKYTLSEEIVNTVSHGIGVLLGIAALVLCTGKAKGPLALTGAIVYGLSMIFLYSISAVYHGLRPGTAKKVLQILDHCTIYLLISGTYTPILLSAFVPNAPAAGWGLLGLQWGTAVIAIIFNAIDLRRYRVFSMAAYIIMGWSIIFFAPTAARLLSREAVLYLLLGGISYTVGAVLYGIGAKRAWFHSVFHVFVVAGSVLQFIAIYLYIL